MNVKYSKLISNLPIGFSSHKIILDQGNHPIDYTFELVNQIFESITGLKEKDVIGKTALEVLPGLQNDEFDWIAYYGDIALNNKTGEFIAYSKLLDLTFTCQVYSPKYLHFNVFYIDYTHGVLSENKLQEHAHLLDTAIKEAPVPIIIYTDIGKVLDISNRWTEITGYTIKDIPSIEAWVKRAYKDREYSQMMKLFENNYLIENKVHNGLNLICAKNQKLYFWDLYSTYLGTNSMSQKVFMTVAIDLTLIKEQEKQIKTLINYNKLTGLPNKEIMIKEFQKDSNIKTVALIDIDNIGYINDLYGYSIGDLTIHKVSSVLKEHVEEKNLYHWSGDEFIITFPFNDKDRLDNFLQAIMKRFNEFFMLENQIIPISISIGVVNETEDYSISEIIKFADYALHEVKGYGGNGFAYFDKQKPYKREQIILFDKLIKTMDFYREIKVFYQPRFSFKNNQISGLEALARISYNGDWVLPQHFIDIAESSGRITALDCAVLEHAAAFQQQCFMQNLYVPIAVNVSPITLTEDFVHFVNKLIDEGKLDPVYLEIEITENVSLDISETLLFSYIKLKKLGIRFLLDDFGKHYSSLKNLTKIEFDAVKIDKDFVLNSEKPEHFRIIKASIELGHDLHMATIAEGIETIEQYNRLKELGCMYFQGFLYQEPVTGDEILVKYVTIPFQYKKDTSLSNN